MKVTLYMAISANGMIAKKDDKTPWSDEEWRSFNNKVKEVGNILIGRRTYGLMKEDKSLDELPCDLIIVLSSRKGASDNKRVVFVPSLQEAIELVKKRGMKEFLVGGGTKTVTTALKSGMVDEVYLDVEPWFLREGLPLFSKLSTDFKLELLGYRAIGKNGVQLHYKIKK